ncbi:endonuclease V [Salinispora arenicola]|uniref:endonuclease V n=1 Tax=Salinispora arenicola TaxID=168697 RepID=UPI0009B5EA95|nr:endonuclease V [Salinispora arenicola]NIL56621.1 endonuclease V [Salinispora arenicola]NIL61605.1 endonuclease V [Salinispora arenicola]
MPGSAAEAEEVQRHLRRQVDLSTRLGSSPKSVVGLDVSYEKSTNRVCAAAVVIELESLAVTEVATAVGEATFPYVPGLLAFREAPVLLDALQGLATEPEVLVCDGYGVAHPRRFGLACHVGVLTGVPSFGVAKTSFIADFVDPGFRRGSWSPLTEGGEVLGHALRTRDGVKPVFVSVGHRIGLDEACEITLRLCPRYRVPEATRQADMVSRRILHSATRS